MNFLIISEKGDYLPIAIKLKNEGHEVDFYVQEIARRGIGENLVNVVASFKDLSPDIVILDVVKSHQTGRRFTCKVFGMSQFMDQFCYNKTYFEKVCSLLDIDYDTDLLPDRGIECWFNGDRFVLPTFHHKYYPHMMADDVGARISRGYMGVRSHIEHDFMLILKKLEPALKKSDYRGVLRLEMNGDKACHVTNKLVIPTLFEMLDTPLSKLISMTVNGSLRYVKCNREKGNLAVKISIPPHPYCPKLFWHMPEFVLKDRALYEYSEPQLKHLWPMNVYRANGNMVSNGNSGDLGYVTSRGITVKESRRRIYRTIDNLKIEHLQYRTDIC